jgi:hypothetical protein
MSSYFVCTCLLSPFSPFFFLEILRGEFFSPTYSNKSKPDAAINI